MDRKSKEKILVVDDNTVNLQLVRSLLLPHGYQSRFVVSAERALESIKVSIPDLILLDVNMPNMNGYELCERLKHNQQTSAIPVIFLSALDGEQDIVKGFDFGGVDYITKPFKEEVLIARISSQLAQKRLKEQLLQSNSKLSREIHKRKKAQIQTELSQRRLFAALEASKESTWEWDPLNESLYLSDSFYSSLGYVEKSSKCHLATWIELIHPEDRERFSEEILKCSKDKSFTIAFEYRIKNADGDYIWMLSRGGQIDLDNYQTTRIFGTTQNIEKRKMYEERLTYLINFDFLTGLPNRLYLHDLLQKNIALSKRNGKKLALLFLDLNRFKIINDSLGHGVGDKLLKAVGNRLTELIRQEDAVARLGGDEFTVFVNNVDSTCEIAVVAERIIESFQRPFSIDGNQIVAGTSIGISIFPDDASNVDELLKKSDAAMYRAKRKGGDCYNFFTHDMNHEASDRLALESELRNAIVNSELEPYFQAKFNIKTGKLDGMEALVRWTKGQSIVTPSEFMPLALETGLILKIDHLMFEKSVRYAKVLHENVDFNGRVSINISPLHFKQADFVERVIAMIDAVGLPTHLVELEITEDAVVENIDHSIEIMHQLKNKGIAIALDDFGTGYSSLSYLYRFPIDTLKIDMSFIHNMEVSDRNKAIVRCIIELAHTLDIKVVAEGVENQRQADILREFYCDYIQGYFYAKPICCDDFSRSLNANEQQHYAMSK